jgi:hypothetical protein
VRTREEHADDTITYAIALIADLAVTRLQSDFAIVQEALTDLKLVLGTGRTKYLLFSSSRKIVSDGLHLYSSDGSIIKCVWFV